jgi:ferric-dicitrate binding protein FerR (iron transport regulator)
MDPLDRELLALRNSIAGRARGDPVEPEPGESAARFYRRVLAQRAAAHRAAHAARNVRARAGAMMPEPIAPAVLSRTRRPPPRPVRPRAGYLVLVVGLLMASLATGTALWIGAGLQAGAGAGIGTGAEGRTTVETRETLMDGRRAAEALPGHDPAAEQP